MITTYFFKIGLMTFILNDESSGLGYSYPRIFVCFPDNSCLNFDLSIGATFKMTEQDFMSWLDGSEIKLNTIEEIRKVFSNLSLSFYAFQEVINTFSQYF